MTPRKSKSAKWHAGCVDRRKSQRRKKVKIEFNRGVNRRKKDRRKS